MFRNNFKNHDILSFIARSLRIDMRACKKQIINKYETITLNQSYIIFLFIYKGIVF